MFVNIRKAAIFCTVVLICKVDGISLKTPSGPIRGTVTTLATSKKVDAYYGIPYAEYPSGPLRFAPPVETKTWTEEFNASDFNSFPCYGEQSDRVHSSEDCLKIHIWVPRPNPTNSTVMVYIHGGGFVGGNPLFFLENGAILAAEENVIVVSMNYRLGVHGFLYFSRPDAPGNVGFLDQQMALKWVQKNIASFGGNPDDVTLFGLSAGGASVGLHLVSTESRGLFHRAILMSGVPLAPWAVKHQGQVLNYSRAFADDMGCHNENINNVMLCLQNMHPNYFLKWKTDDRSLDNTAPIGPTVDGRFLTDFPRNILEFSPNSVNAVDIMVGTTANEGSAFLFLDLPKGINITEDGRITKTDFQSILNWAFRRRPLSFRENLMEIYLKDISDDPIALRNRMGDLYSDLFFNCPSQDFADLYAEKTKKRVYRYVSDHYFPNIGPMEIPRWMGTTHAMDALLYMGIAAAGPPAFTKEEAELSRKVMKWWANFARTGNPNGNDQNVNWPESTKEQQKYLRISLNPEVQNNFRSQTCRFVNALGNGPTF